MSEQFRSLIEDLHRQYYPMVYNICLGFLKGDSEPAKDLSQEVFINAWNALDGFRKEASYKTWLYRITVNSCLQYLRKEKNKQKLPLETIEEAIDESTKADYQPLYNAIGQLSEVDRLIIMMVLDEVEYDEIAEVFGLNSVNLRVKIHRIKARLKKIMENE